MKIEIIGPKDRSTRVLISRNLGRVTRASHTDFWISERACVNTCGILGKMRTHPCGRSLEQLLDPATVQAKEPCTPFLMTQYFP